MNEEWEYRIIDRNGRVCWSGASLEEAISERAYNDLWYEDYYPHRIERAHPQEWEPVE